MTNKLTKQAVTRYSPGQSASAGAPARCFLSGYAPSTLYGGAGFVRYEPMSPAKAYAEYNRLQNNTFGMVESTRYQWNYSIVCLPAQPATPYKPAGTTVDMRQGWNASSDSIYNDTGDFALLFDYDKFPVGVIVGLAPYPAAGTLPSTVSAGVYLRDGVVEVMEAGVVVATAPYTPLDQKVVAIARVGDSTVIRVGDWSYVADGVPAGEPAQARALLYLAGDYVDNPRIVVDATGRARGGVSLRHVLPSTSRARGSVGFRMAKLEARGRVGTTGRATAVVDYSASARGSVGFSGAIGRAGAEGALSLPGLSLFGGFAGSTARASGELHLPAMEVVADGGYAVPNVVGGQLGLPGLMLAGDGQTGEVASGQVVMPRFAVLGADYPYGQGVATLPPLVAFGVDPSMPDGYVRMYEVIQAQASATSSGVLFAAIRSELGLESEITVALLTGVGMYDSVILDDNIGFAATLQAVLRSDFVLSDQAARGDWSVNNAHYAAVQYATNLLTGAVTRLDGFNFMSFCRVGQTTYGVAPDGLYEIGPNEDPIDAIVEFAAVGTESAAVKGLDYVYLGMNTDGDVYVAVRGDGEAERVYRAVESRDMHRVKGGKGIRARQWTCRLELVAATRAELDSVEWIAPHTARRWGR